MVSLSYRNWLNINFLDILKKPVLSNQHGLFYCLEFFPFYAHYQIPYTWLFTRSHAHSSSHSHSNSSAVQCSFSQSHADSSAVLRSLSLSRSDFRSHSGGYESCTRIVCKKKSEVMLSLSLSL